MKQNEILFSSFLVLADNLSQG